MKTLVSENAALIPVLRPTVVDKAIKSEETVKLSKKFQVKSRLSTLCLCRIQKLVHFGKFQTVDRKIIVRKIYAKNHEDFFVYLKGGKLKKFLKVKKDN